MASDELMDVLRNKERPPADRTMPYVKVGEHLEEFGTSRAHFGHLSDAERIRVGKRVVILCSRHRVDGPIVGNEEEIFYHLCGAVGIDFEESRAIWSNAYRGNVTMEDINELWEDEE
jgi:hypothetical protein